MASIYVNITVLALLSLIVSANSSEESSKEVVVKNSPVFNSISKIYTQLHYPGTRQQYNQYNPHARIPDRSFTRFSEVTKSGFAKKQLLSSYEDKTVRRIGSRGQFEGRGPQQRIQRPNYSNDRAASQYGPSEHLRYVPQTGLSQNWGNRASGYGRRDEEGERYPERSYGSRGGNKEGSEEEGKEEEGGKENKEQEQESERGEGRKESEQNSGRRTGHSSRRRDDQRSVHLSNSGPPQQGSLDGRSSMQLTGYQNPRNPSSRNQMNIVRERYPVNQFLENPRNQFQQNPGSQFQQNPGNKFQQNHANQFQRNQGSQFQQNRGNQFQQNLGNQFQQNRGNQFQQNLGNQFQKYPVNQFQQNPGNQFQQSPANQFQRYSGPQNQMQTNGQIQGNQYQQNRGNGQPGNFNHTFSGARIPSNPSQQPTGPGNRG